MAVDLVTEAGCCALEAANADQAIILLDAHPEISVLFTDINMPGSMDGLELAAVARADRPEIVVIIASGYRKPGTDIPDGAQFFPKPYSPQLVIQAIKEGVSVGFNDR